MGQPDEVAGTRGLPLSRKEGRDIADRQTSNDSVVRCTRCAEEGTHERRGLLVRTTGSPLPQPLDEELAVEEEQGKGLAGEGFVAGAGELRAGGALDLVQEGVQHVLR